MDINLRKAAHLEKMIQDRVSELSKQLDTKIEMTIYADAVLKRDEARREFKVRLARIAALQRVRYGIRAKLAEANAHGGISRLVAELNQQREWAEVLGKLVKAKPAVTATELQLEVTGRRGRFEKGDSYYDQEKLSVELLTEDDLRQVEADLRTARRTLVDINDKMLAANVSDHVSLMPDEAKLLVAEGLV